MKKLLPLFIGCAVMSQNAAMAAITITKAKPVATKQTSSVEAGASLLPTVMNLVGGIKQLSQQHKALTDECIPTSAEITFVNNTIKEWAKTGAKTAEEVEVALGMSPCGPGDSYEFTVRMAEGADERDLICYDTYDASSADGMVWLGYPIAVSTYYCTDGSLSGCSNKNKKYVSNTWVGQIFWRRKWQPTPVILPGESHGWRSLVGYNPWGHQESEKTVTNKNINSNHSWE